MHAGLLSWVNQSIDHELMQQAANQLLGTHDFSSFRSADCQAKQPVRTVKALNVTRHGDQVRVDITANGFLHNMVRIVVGSLVQVGKRERPPEWLGELLAARDRRLAGATLTPGGLYFLQPTYPVEFEIPDFSTLWQ